MMLVVKNPPANAEDINMQLQCLGREDPLEEGMATTPVFLPGESHGQRTWWATVCGPAVWDRTEAN